MSKLFNIRPRWRNLLLARILLFAISIVLSSSGEDIGPNDSMEERLVSPLRLSGGNVRGLQSKSAKSSKSNKSVKSKGSKTKASKASGSKKAGKASSKMGKSSYKSNKSKASKVSGSKSKSGKSASKISKSKAAKSATESKSKIGKSLKSLDSGDDTDESRDGNSSSDSTNNPLPSEDNEQSDSVDTSSSNRDDINYAEEVNSLDNGSYSGSMDAEEAVEHIDITTSEEEIVSTAEDGKTYNVIQFPVSSKDETNIDTTHLDGDFMEERIDESEDTEVDIDEIMTEIIEESRAFENKFDESDEEFDPSRESVE